MSFKEYMQSRKQQFEDLSKKFQEESSKEFSNDDDRFWYPAADKAGNGSAVIRFLPAKTDAKYPLPQAKTWNHAFQGPTGAWFIDKCRTSLGKDEACPVCEANGELWRTEKKENRDIASARKRKLYYYSNIYIISDPQNPKNDGTVKIYRYGKKIFDMLNDKMHPSFDDIPKINPFDLLEGANFRLRFKMDAGYRTYAPSTFDEPSPLFKDEVKMEEVYNEIHDLWEFVDPDSFTSYAKQKERFDRVVGNGAPSFARKEKETEVERAEEPAWEGDDEFDVSKEMENVETQDFDKFFEDLEN